MHKADMRRMDEILAELPDQDTNEDEAAPEPTRDDEDELTRLRLVLEDAADGGETFDE